VGGHPAIIIWCPVPDRDRDNVQDAGRVGLAGSPLTCKAPKAIFARIAAWEEPLNPLTGTGGILYKPQKKPGQRR